MKVRTPGKAKGIRPSTAASSTSASPFPSSLLLALLLVVATLIAYFPAWNGQPIWDDDAHLTKPELRSLGGLYRIWFEPGASQQYYPLVHTVFWLEQKLWGDAVLPHHLVNILFHVAAALLFFKVLEQLKIPGAWLAAGIFALHPIEVESVAWMSEMKNTLSAVFFFTSVLFYLRFDRSRAPRFYIAALLTFFLGLLCKTVIATLPAVMLVIFWWQRGKLSAKRDVIPLIPFFLLGIAGGLFTAWVEKTYIGAQGATFDFNFIERGLIAGRAFWFYLTKVLWPAGFIFIYPRWQISASAWGQYLFPLGALGLVAILFLLRKQSRAPLATILLFAGMLFPALGFVNVYPFLFSFVADHFQYLAGTAVIALVSAGIMILFDRFNVPSAGRYSVSLGLLAVLGILTFLQSRIYADPLTLYRDTIQRNPECWMAENNLSVVLTNQGQFGEATAHAKQALKLRPNYLDAHLSLGNIALAQHRADEAIAEFRAALAIEQRLPKVHNNLGNALRLKGQDREAIAEYEKTIRLDPHSLSSRNNLAWILAACPDVSQRNGARAVEMARTAQRLSNGTNVVVLHTLAAAYAQNGEFEKAVSTAQRAAQLATAQNNATLANALHHEIALYQSGSTYREAPAQNPK